MRRESALQRLKSVQQKWRQNHVEWEKRRRARLEEEFAQYLAEDKAAAGEESGGGSGGDEDMSPSTDSGVEGEAYLPGEKAAGRRVAPLSLDLDTFSGPSEHCSPQNEGWSSSCESSPLESPVAVSRRTRSNSPRMSLASSAGLLAESRAAAAALVRGRCISEDGGVSPLPDSEPRSRPLLRRGNSKSVCTPKGTPSASTPSQSCSQLLSPYSSKRSSVQSHETGTVKVTPGSAAWLELFNESAELYGESGPQWWDLKSPTSSSQPSSKRSSITQSGAARERSKSEEATILEEEEEGGQRQAAEGWQGMRVAKEWRREFHIEALNELAVFFESSPVSDSGACLAALAAVQEVLGRSLGLPHKAVAREAEARDLISGGPTRRDSLSGRCQSVQGYGLEDGWPETPKSQATSVVTIEVGEQHHPEGENPSFIAFRTLACLLDFARGVAERVQKETPEALWSESDLSNIRAIFRRFMNVNARVPVAHLFAAMEALDFMEVTTADVEQQTRLVDVTRRVLSGRTSQNTRATKQLNSSLSLKEFTQIVAVALCEKEKAWREQDYACEIEVYTSAGFGPLEVEDLRELHNTFSDLQMEGATNAAMAKMTVLFHSCGVRDLMADEVAKLRSIIRMRGPGSLPTTSPSDVRGDCWVPFPTFMIWMHAIFQEGVGDLNFQGQSDFTLEILEPHSGFTAAMLRQHLLKNRKRRRSRCESDGLAVPSVPPSRRTSAALSWAMGKGRATPRGGGATSAAGSASMLGTPRGRTNSAGRRRSGSLQASRNHSRSTSMNTSRRGSKGASRAARGADASAVGGSGQGEVVEENTAVLLLTGLPPSEAMLSRKPYRACSVDLTNTVQIPELLGTALGAGAVAEAAAEAGEFPQPPQARDSQSSSQTSAATNQLDEVKLKLQQLRVPGGAPPQQDHTAKRKVKKGMDSEMLLNDAMVKLAQVQQDRDKDREDDA